MESQTNAADASVDRVVHTPGPWTIMCDEARGNPRCLITDKNGNEIAAINPYCEFWNENAELIAAIPQLLQALQEIASKPTVSVAWAIAEKALVDAGLKVV